MIQNADNGSIDIERPLKPFCDYFKVNMAASRLEILLQTADIGIVHIFSDKQAAILYAKFYKCVFIII